MISEKRLRQYFRKIEHINQSLKLVIDWISEKSEEEFLRDIKTRYATYKAFQEAVEAAMDIVAMLVKDAGMLPKDDYSNIETLKSKSIIKPEIADALAQCNSLRNWLIHKYNKLDDKIAFEKINELIEWLEGFIEVVEDWLKKHS